MRKRAADEPNSTLRELFDAEVRSSQANTSVSFAELKHSMYMRRRKAMPRLPDNINEFDDIITQSPYSSVGNKPFYRGFENAGENRYAAIFATDDQLQQLAIATERHLDATFRVVPRLFYQLFSILVPHGDILFTSVFVLMTKKTTELYVKVFRRILNISPTFSPQHVMSDYEDGAVKAIRIVFGNDVAFERLLLPLLSGYY